jgi:DNA repair protein RadC
MVESSVTLVTLADRGCVAACPPKPWRRGNQPQRISHADENEFTRWRPELRSCPIRPSTKNSQLLQTLNLHEDENDFSCVFVCFMVKPFRMSQNLRLKDQPVSERPRERLAALGADALSHAELIAILLRTGLKGVNAVEVGKQLLQKFGTLHALAQAGIQDLQKVKGIGRDKAVTLMAAFALARKMAGELQYESPVLDNPEAVVRLLREFNLTKKVETLQVLLLNTRHKLIRVEEISDGTLDTILVHPREVFKCAIAANAAAIVLAHNHPSGDPTPSEADVKVTRDLIRAGQLLKIDVIDHIIIGRATTERAKDYSSLRELGYFYQ